MVAFSESEFLGEIVAHVVEQCIGMFTLHTHTHTYPSSPRCIVPTPSRQPGTPSILLIAEVYAREKELKLLKLTDFSYLLSKLVLLKAIMLGDLEGLGRRWVFEGQQREGGGGYSPRLEKRNKMDGSFN